MGRICNQPTLLAAIAAILLIAMKTHEAAAFHSAFPTTRSLSGSIRPAPASSSTSKSNLRLELSPIMVHDATPLLVAATGVPMILDSSVTLSDAAAASGASFSELVKNTDFLVFVAGIFPFMWATYEFWRRIMFGESFGTGTDSVIIGMNDAPSDSRGQRVLGQGALITAYVLFVCAFGTLAVVGYSVATSAPPSAEDLAAGAALVSTNNIGAPEALSSTPLSSI